MTCIIYDKIKSTFSGRVKDVTAQSIRARGGGGALIIVFFSLLLPLRPFPLISIHFILLIVGKNGLKIKSDELFRFSW